MSAERPITVLIAALGGEGGGVLTDWIVNAAHRKGLPVQATSIPGVAQRTGATTYYVEILPTPTAALAGRAPILALAPAVGEVDLMVASEFLEAGRAIAGGFVTPDRTTLIASTHRVFTVDEKIEMGDGRFDLGRLFKAAKEQARRTVLFDAEACARETRSVINSVLLGAIAGSDLLPISAEDFAAGIKEEGKAVESNLAGFRAGLAAVGGAAQTASATENKRGTPRVAAASVEARVAQFPEAARDVVTHGVKRLIDYQDARYAARYLDRLEPFRSGDVQVLRETARHLAVRLSFEDLIRVAQAKTRPERIERILKEAGAFKGEPVVITEFFKPGFRELADVLPPSLARALLAWAGRTGRLDRRHLGMEVKTSTVNGFLRVWLLARLRRLRRFTYRFVEEQRAIDAWLDLVRRAAALDRRLALEVAECARLIKGYGETHRRGTSSYARIVEAVIEPALRRGDMAAADAVAKARTAALADPEGESLDKVIAPLTFAPVAARGGGKLAAE
jgi:indolepyruvate ferredoxin oxidoreductase beta subunit